MTMIQLFDGPGDDMDVDIMAFVDDKTGDLIVEGCDSGPGVEKARGDFDYEYWLRVLKDDKAQLLSSFRAGGVFSDAALLKAVANKFNTITALSDLRKWCEVHQVPAQFSSIE